MLVFGEHSERLRKSFVENDSLESLLKHVAAIQAGTDKRAIEEAVRSLTPLIEETAKRVCTRHRVNQQVLSDFVEDAVNAIVAPRIGRDGTVRSPRIMKYNHARGLFPAWLWTVLNNRLLDLMRSAKRRTTRGLRFAPQEKRPSILQNVPDLRHLQPEPFNADDIERISSWPVLDRLLLLVTHGLGRRIPDGIWTAWCAQAGLSGLFPPDEIPRVRGEWIAIFADRLGVSRNALQNRYRRRLERLESERPDSHQRNFRDN